MLVMLNVFFVLKFLVDSENFFVYQLSHEKYKNIASVFYNPVGFVFCFRSCSRGWDGGDFAERGE